jgi:membrane protein insertase Oxa1/YidC/SpoIIIJ
LQLPSGLTLYILINTVLSVAPTLLVQRTDVGVVKKPA